MENETLTTTGLAKLFYKVHKVFSKLFNSIIKQNIQVKVWDSFVEI